MPTHLRQILQKYRASAASEREKGTYFEQLTKVWLENAPTQREQFARVLTYAEWARENRLDQRDTGIDLVAQLADSPDDWCAVQCKFYREGYRIQKSDIDSFFTASGKRPFVRRMIVDTTDTQWSEHADAALDNQNVQTTRVGLSDLDDSGIDWAAFAREKTVRLIEKKRPRQHQIEALAAVREGLQEADRGKLIMACGTGKTYTALQIAEALAGKGGRVLFLVPSLSLMSQTIREWSIDCAIPLRSFAVCSDVQVGVRKAKDGDLADIDVHDLEIPATTHGAKLAAKASAHDPDRMTAVFSTYQSIQAIHDAQAKFGLPAFDLIVCDEAHRTTGVTLADEDESNFIRVHDANYIKGAKRIYMTATPRIYGEAVKKTADENDAALCSMDNPALFGETLFTRNFSWAVQNGLLTDYKVIVLAVDEASVSASLQNRLADANSELVLDDATKIVGCYKALTKADLKPDVAGDTGPMRRALAFARDIKRSKMVEAEFERVAEDWRDALDSEVAETIPPLECEVQHVDGGFSAHARNHLLSWLKEETGENGACRILTNARCLSEGVDVPALDAILFLHPRKSQIDVVQSVGRVMRRAEGKKMGYVILPVGVPAGIAAEDALDNNDKYKVVWQILNALRAHDDRLDATINKIDLGADPGDRIEIVAVSNSLPTRSKACATGLDIGAGGGAGDVEPGDAFPAERRGDQQLQFGFDEFSKAIMARIVKKCGTRAYWEDWAKDVARIAEVHVIRIRAAVKAAGSEEKHAFETFLSEIRDDLNDSITEDEAIEMLAQHLITRPVFDALFEGYSFAQNNPVSKALQSVLDVLDRQSLEKEAESLSKFYASVKMRAEGIESASAKQKIVVELYDKFFKTAFPKLTARLGIVYTPVEVVDFIIKSVDEVLQSEFGQTLGSEGVHIIDPFVGTGTFITRLLQSGLIKPEQMAHKYRHEIHANEIVLLAYYIAAINIEAVYHEQTGADYEPFPGICLTDTFQLYEQDRDLVSDMLAVNTNRRTRQKELDIRVIFGNPPYSVGQGDANDNAANLSYPRLDGRIEQTYAHRSDAKSKRVLYDSYIRAIRWASDRIGEAGVIGFVTNAGWLDSNTADGLRKCLHDEFSSIHVFHLRGNARTVGEQRRKEKDNIFDQGSRAPIAITVLVKNPYQPDLAEIRFHDVGDYLTKHEKLLSVSRFGSIGGLSLANAWRTLTPDDHGDWLKQRDDAFEQFIPLGDRKNPDGALFGCFSLGVGTNRDAWAVNPSRITLATNMRRLIAAYNAEADRFDAANLNASRDQRSKGLDNFLDADASKVSWTFNLKQNVVMGKRHSFDDVCLVPVVYRPFTCSWLYYSRGFNERVYQMPRIFPLGAQAVSNLFISVPGPGNVTPFSVLMGKALFDLSVIAAKSGSQCFPRYIYDEPVQEDGDPQGALFKSDAAPQRVRRDAITDDGLKYFADAYPGEAISKDDVFYYVYGLLHSKEYRERYADNLSKQLPRIPLMKRAEDFRAFVAAGRALGDLHVNFESVEPYNVTIKEGDLRLAHIADPVAYYRVEKMKFGGKRPNLDKTTVVYNPRITFTNIPLEAYDYVVNGKPALEWVMERQCVKVDPASGIVNDANRYAIETVGDPAYPLKLFCRIITVSLETMEIVRSLPALDILEAGDASDLDSAQLAPSH